MSGMESIGCLIPASVYYEWPGTGKDKQAHYIHAAAGLMFAGLWERWTPHDGELVDMCTIVTMDAVDEMLELHNQTPLMLPPPSYTETGWKAIPIELRQSRYRHQGVQLAKRSATCETRDQN